MCRLCKVLLRYPGISRRSMQSGIKRTAPADAVLCTPGEVFATDIPAQQKAIRTGGTAQNPHEATETGLLFIQGGS